MKVIKENATIKNISDSGANVSISFENVAFPRIVDGVESTILTNTITIGKRAIGGLLNETFLNFGSWCTERCEKCDCSTVDVIDAFLRQFTINVILRQIDDEYEIAGVKSKLTSNSYFIEICPTDKQKVAWQAISDAIDAKNKVKTAKILGGLDLTA